MFSKRSRTIAVALAAGALVAITGSAATASPDPTASTGPTDADRIKRHIRTSADFSIEPNPSTKKVEVIGEPSATQTVTDANGKLLSRKSIPIQARPRPDLLEPKQQTDYACVVNNIGDPRLEVYEPYSLTSEGESHSTEFIYHLYGVWKARTIDDEVQSQFERCAVGGATAWNSYQHTLSAAMTWDEDPVVHKIGQKWGSEVVNGAVSASLGFQAGPPALSVNGGVNVQDQDVHQGNPGAHGRVDAIQDFIDPLHNGNRVNGYYIAPNNWRWDGTGDFQGNTVQALWEYPRDGDFWGTYASGWVTEAHCSVPSPLDCAKDY